MATNLVMCDTNIFIHWFNGDEQTIQQLRKIGLENVALSVITAMELIQGADNKQQLSRLRKNLNNYSIVNFSADVSELSLRFVEDYKLSHHLQIPDAIIAATAVHYQIPLFTYNTKDFKYIPNIQLYDYSETA